MPPAVCCLSQPALGPVAPVQGSQISLTFTDKTHEGLYYPRLTSICCSLLARSLVFAAMCAKGSSRFLLDFLPFLSDLCFCVSYSLRFVLLILFQIANSYTFLLSLSGWPSSSAFTISECTEGWIRLSLVCAPHVALECKLHEGKKLFVNCFIFHT